MAVLLAGLLASLRGAAAYGLETGRRRHEKKEQKGDGRRGRADADGDECLEEESVGREFGLGLH